MSAGNVTVPASRRCIAQAFGSVLKERRKAKGISQEELAYRIEIDRTYPSLLERGLRTPTLAVLLVIAQALDVGPDELIAETLSRLRLPGNAPASDRKRTEWG